jgi:23S rRNA pseudouridine955/2504/2580 synthase
VSGVSQIIVASKDDGLRLDRWFKENYPGLGFGRLQKMLRTGQIRLDGKRVKTSTRLNEGQTLRVPPLNNEKGPQQKVSHFNPEDKVFIEGLILHEDDDIMVLNKPSGLASQGGSGTRRHVDGMLASFEKNGERPRLVHRLDRDTSGLLLVAKTRKAASKLGSVFRTRSARKIYWALTVGVPRPAQGEISAFLKKMPSNIPGTSGEIVRVVEQGEAGAQHSHSYYSVIEQAGQKYAWVSLKPVTGRTHQLRVHMAELGTPIYGDPKYLTPPEGEGRDWFIAEGLENKLHLHARRLVIPHPSGGKLDLTAPLPEHMKKSWETLGLDPHRYDIADDEDL